MRSETATLSSLLAFLKDGDIERLRARIAEPLCAFSRGLAERGRSAPIGLTTTDESALVTREHIAALLNAYIERKLSPIELRYLASALDTSPDAKYDSEMVCQVISTLSSDEDVNAAQLLRELGHGAAGGADREG